MNGNVRVDAFAQIPLERLVGEEFPDELRAGAAFHRIALGNLSKTERQRAARTFAKRHRGTLYEAAIQGLGKQGDPFATFLAKQATLEKFDSPPRTVS